MLPETRVIPQLSPGKDVVRTRSTLVLLENVVHRGRALRLQLNNVTKRVIARAWFLRFLRRDSLKNKPTPSIPATPLTGPMMRFLLKSPLPSPRARHGVSRGQNVAPSPGRLRETGNQSFAFQQDLSGAFSSLPGQRDGAGQRPQVLPLGGFMIKHRLKAPWPGLCGTRE